MEELHGVDLGTRVAQEPTAVSRERQGAAKVKRPAAPNSDEAYFT
jgi:hypothetical protein